MYQTYECIVVWHNKIKNIYYYKKIRLFYNQYHVGFKNSYGHEVILIIQISEIRQKWHNKLKRRVINKIIARLEKVR